MRFLGLIGLVLALAIVGVLAKKQLGAGRAALPAVAASAQGNAPVDAPSSATVRDQSQHIQQQYQQALDAALQQQRREMPEEAR
ncbi:MAG: hypothetical protein Q4A98_10845 [Comamonadaceae bacterium]|nr:hypothetical protein [Comamonadaceae bacterium]